MRGSSADLNIVLLAVATILAAAGHTHGAEKTIQPGDKVKVVNGPAPVKVGKDTLTTVKTGTELTALKVQGPWVKVSVERDGKRIVGWIYSKKCLQRVPDQARPPVEELPAAKPPPTETPAGPQAGPTTQGVVVATEAQLLAADKEALPKALKLVQQLMDFAKDPRANDLTYTCADDDFTWLRPLPAAAVEELLKCLSSSTRGTRRDAGVVLARHQRNPGSALGAIRKARAVEKDDAVRDVLDAAIGILEAAPEKPRVLADSAEFTDRLESAFVRETKRPGRELWRGAWRRREDDGSIAVTQTWSPVPEQLPEKLILGKEAAGCAVTIGWQWRVHSRADKPYLLPPPVGAVAHLQGLLALSKSRVPAGSILMHTTQGWSAVTESQAIGQLGCYLRLRAGASISSDYVQTGALGAAALGPRAKQLVPALLAAAEEHKDTLTAGYCAIALARTRDKSLLPKLRAIKGLSPGVANLFDAAIAELEQ